jgi:hypothetical protein
VEKAIGRHGQWSTSKEKVVEIEIEKGMRRESGERRKRWLASD